MSEREHTPPGSGTPDPKTVPVTQPLDATAPVYSSRPVAFRRADKIAGLLLVLAGIAAGLSLLVRWLAGDDLSGLDLVRRGFDEFGELGDTGFWQPLAIVLGGAALFVLGLLMFLPLRTHKVLGVLALLVTALVLAGVLVPLTQAGFELNGFAVGFWLAMIVAVLGLLGSVKALLTRPKYDTAAPPA
jgi:hypothetical protein